MKNHIVTGLIFLFSFISCNKLDSDKLVGTWDIISSLPEGIKSAEYVFDGEYLEIILFLQNGHSVREAIYEYFVEGDNISLINQEIGGVNGIRTIKILRYKYPYLSIEWTTILGGKETKKTVELKRKQ